MGQKVNPHGIRVGINKEWNSTWYAEKDFGNLLLEDNKIRKFVKKEYYQAGISDIQIERTTKRVKVIIKTSRPGILIGKKGAGVDKIQSDIQKLSENKVFVDVVEVKKPEKDAQLVAEKIASELENRVSFRKAMKQGMQRAIKAGAKGIKTSVSGRLGGVEMARTEHYHEGTIPLQTLRADIDYGFAEAHTTYGKIGVKVWVYNGEILPTKKNEVVAEGSVK